MLSLINYEPHMDSYENAHAFAHGFHAHTFACGMTHLYRVCLLLPDISGR